MRTNIGPFAVFAALLLAIGSAWALEEICDPAKDCAVEGDICCPHEPGPDAPFTCAPPPCYRSSGELCTSTDKCTTKGDICCPHEPGPDAPFTCPPLPCYR
jgi:hypothetical protein